ncbi:MAG: hypothetical protein H6868_09425 [Rhodospirillales bacterium]|nr:hypothetical protein [Rhodospirillales bacterium]
MNKVFEKVAAPFQMVAGVFALAVRNANEPFDGYGSSTALLSRMNARLKRMLLNRKPGL